MADLECHLSKLRAALLQDAVLRDLLWARERCREARVLHEGVWRNLPSKSEVLNELIPLLDRAAAAITAIAEVSDRPADLAELAQNVRDRAANLRNYVHGLPSQFAPS